MSDSFLSIYNVRVCILYFHHQRKSQQWMWMNFYLEHSPKPIGSLYTVLYHMIAFIYVTSKPPSGHKMRNKSTKSPDRNRLNVIKCKTTETLFKHFIEIQTWSSIQIMYHRTFYHKTHLGTCIEQYTIQSKKFFKVQYS